MATGGQYTKPDNTPGTEEDTVDNVVIQIDKTNGYSSGTIQVYTGSGQTTVTNKKNMSVSETLDSPFHLIRIYTHYYYKFVPGSDAQFIKMNKAGLTFKNRGKSTGITLPATANNVKYVCVYHFGGVPILICIAIGTSSPPGTYKYYKPETTPTNPFPDTTEWTPIPNSASPGTDELNENEPPTGTNNKDRLPKILQAQYKNIIFYYVGSITVIG